jgi:hypothetical protein
MLGAFGPIILFINGLISSHALRICNAIPRKSKFKPLVENRNERIIKSQEAHSICSCDSRAGGVDEDEIMPAQEAD